MSDQTINQTINQPNITYEGDKNQTYTIEYMNILLKKYKYMSYNDICIYIENDSNYIEYLTYMKYIEYLSEKEEERLFREILKERRRLYALGLYELEEGEILE
jgi:hypothetical protein